MMEKILVSACLLGINVRYNAKVKNLSQPILTKWQQQGRLIAVCPEVAGGLPIPRLPAEIIHQQHLATEQVINSGGQDVSHAFALGAEHALSLCKAHNIRYALLKESSPSCGSQIIYNGQFENKKVKGQGITTNKLTDAGIKVFSEKNFEQLIELIE